MGNKRGAPPKFKDPVTGVIRAANGKERQQMLRDKRKAEKQRKKFVATWDETASETLGEFFNPHNLFRTPNHFAGKATHLFSKYADDTTHTIFYCFPHHQPG
jgi:hypothetical protein